MALTCNQLMLKTGSHQELITVAQLYFRKTDQRIRTNKIGYNMLKISKTLT